MSYETLNPWLHGIYHLSAMRKCYWQRYKQCT